MNKKTKWAIPFAVLAITCGVAAGCGDGHTHEYTKQGSNATQHWKECPEDGEKDKSTIADHGEPNSEGKCPDCGYQLVEHTHSYTKWGNSITQHWKECPDDGEIDASTKAPHGTPDAEGKCPDCEYQILTYVNQGLKLVTRKDGANTNLASLDGVEIKLSRNGTELTEDTDYQLVKGEGNALTIKGIVSGEYTVTVVTADGEYRYSGKIKLDGAEKELVLQYNYAIASAQSYYVDLTHMNDTDRSLAINASSVDTFWQWNAEVPEITLNLAEEVKNSKNVKLEFNLKASNPNNAPNNAFGVVMTETYKGVALSIWDTQNDNDGIKVHNLRGQQLGSDGYSSDGAATLKWLETAIYGADGVDIRVVRANHTLTCFAKNGEGKWVAFRSLACPEDAGTDLKFMGAGSDFVISGIAVNGNYTAEADTYSATLTVLDKEDNKVVLAEGTKGLLIAGDTSYEVELTANTDGTYALSGEFVPGLYSFSILGKVNGYSSASVQIVDNTEDLAITLKNGEYAAATVYGPDSAEGVQLADCVTVTDGNIVVNGNRVGVTDFWQWGVGNTVPAATLNISDEIKSSRNVIVDFKLKATNSNNAPNNSFGIALTELHNGLNLSIWNTENAGDGVAYYELKGTYLGNDEYNNENNTDHDKWLETAIYSVTGVNMRAERDGGSLKFYARKDGAWYKFYETECYEYAETMIKFLAIGSDYEISGIKVRVPKEGEESTYEVTAGFADNASHGYSVDLDSYDVEEGGSVVLTVTTSDADAAWSWFPNAIKVNGVALDFSTVTVESIRANVCKYTVTISDIIENTNIVVEVAKGTKVKYGASVNDPAMGSLVCDMEDDEKVYYWNDACKLTLTAKEGYHLKNIVIGEGDSQVTVTEDWTKNGLVYEYTFTVTGDIKVVATYEQTPSILLSEVKLNVVDKADAAVTLTDGAELTLEGDYNYTLTLTKNSDGTYTAASSAGSIYEGVYTCSFSDGYLFYVTRSANVVKDGASVKLTLGSLATPTKYHHGNHQNMGECDFETLIEVDNGSVKINTATANGKKVDGFWCWNSPVPETTLNITDDVKNAKHVQLDFNLKVANGNNDPNNAFGIALAGYKGVAISLWNINDEKIDLHELTECKLGADGWGYADTYAAYGWVETLAESADGVNLRAIRSGVKIKFLAKNADGQYVQFFETTCGADDLTDIKFIGMGSDYTVSAIAVSFPEVEQKPVADVTYNVTAKDVDGATAVTLAQGTVITLIFKDDETLKYTYTVGSDENPSQLAIGEYAVKCYGYADTTVEVGANGGEVAICLEKVIAYTTYDSVAIDHENGVIDVTGAGVSDRHAKATKNAEIVIPESLKTSETLTLTFNVKTTQRRSNGEDWAAKRFGVQIGEGAVGFFVFLRVAADGYGGADSADVVKLNPGSLDVNPSDESKWHDGDEALVWLVNAVNSDEGLNVKVVRGNGVIEVYAQNGADWVLLSQGAAGDLEIAGTVKNEIRLIGCGDDYRFSNISVGV